MHESSEQLKAELLKLPKSMRAEIALHLIDSLDEPSAASSEADIEGAWIEESVRRLEAYHRGEMKAYPIEEVIAELLQGEG